VTADRDREPPKLLGSLDALQLKRTERPVLERSIFQTDRDGNGCVRLTNLRYFSRSRNRRGRAWVL